MNETLDSSVEARASLTRRRFSSRSLIGICRCVVAVGTARLACMFSAMRAATPRRGTRSPEITGPAAGGGAGGASEVGRAAGRTSAETLPSFSPKRSRKYWRHSSSTAEGLVRYRWKSSST